MLKPENRPIYEKVKHLLDTEGKCLLITHPGRGKSFITDEYVQEAGLKNVLCVCPRVSVAKQWTEDHSDCIRAVTYSAFSRMSMQDIGNPDLIVIDEAHHAGAPKWGRIIPQIISAASPSGMKVLGLTADPIRWSDKRRDVGAEFFDGYQVYGPTIRESIDDGFLQSFTYVLSMYGVQSKLAALKKKAAQLPVDQQDEIFTLIGKMRYLPDIVTDTVKCIRAYLPQGDHKAIVFCSRISEIPKAQALMLEACPGMSQYVIHTKQSMGLNKKEFDAWKADRNAALFNVDMVSEGVHAPDADVVVMFRKTRSPSLYVQHIGRAVSPDNPNAVIFDIVSNAGNITKVLKHAHVLDAMEDNGKAGSGHNGSATGRTGPRQVIIKNLARPAADALRKIEELLSQNRPWTDAEVAYLEANMGRLSAGEMHDGGLPDRSPASIMSYAARHYPPGAMRRLPDPVPWTAARTEWAMKLHAEGKPLDYICKLMTVEMDDLVKHLESQGVDVK